MPTTYRVARGQCLSSIAAEHGFADWRTIYDDPGNEALRRKRPNPNVLCPGDELTLPDKLPKTVRCATGLSHRFVAKRPSCRLRIQLCDGSGRPFAGTRYRLTVSGLEVEGTTDGAGMVDQPVPPHATRGELLLWSAEDPAATSRLRLELGGLDPAEELTGAQARLANLGFGGPGSTGQDDDRTRAALKDFQRLHGLDVSGRLDRATSDKLRQLHDE